MNNEIENLNAEVKDTLIKMDEAINLLKDGKIILSYNKMLGLRQKIGFVLQYTDKMRKSEIESNKN